MTASVQPSGIKKRLAANGAIVLSFIVALEFVIMISPFAFLFYAALNPFLLALNQSAVTRWLTAFFLPHMIVPPTLFLQIVRVLGSVLFVAGILTFLVCAIQVYGGKLFKLGVAQHGLYRVVRHPQYLALGVAALGMALLWPRVFTLVLFAVMLWLYYLLARDEEGRMLRRFGDGYGAYLQRTGMFLPRRLERVFSRSEGPRPPLTIGKTLAILVALLVVCTGIGLALRAYTVHRLPLAEADGIDVIAISPDDLPMASDLMDSVLGDPEVASKLQPLRADNTHRVLAYVIPVDYVMQGMIADTGEQWKLFQHHNTARLIVDYVIHPFGHLSGGHHAGMSHGTDMHSSPLMQRRIIFVEISSPGRQPLASAYDDFNVNAQRNPLCFVDVHIHMGQVLQFVDLHGGSGWGTVPTPMF